MYLKSLELQTKDRCNYSIEISPNNDTIFFSLDETGYLISKSKFLSSKDQNINTLINTSKNPDLKIFTLEDTIAKAKFSYDNNYLIIGDQTKTITKFNLSENYKNIIEYKNSKTWKFRLDKINRILFYVQEKIVFFYMIIIKMK